VIERGDQCQAHEHHHAEAQLADLEAVPRKRRRDDQIGERDRGAQELERTPHRVGIVERNAVHEAERVPGDLGQRGGVHGDGVDQTADNGNIARVHWSPKSASDPSGLTP
jgi:hypothetical protein